MRIIDMNINDFLHKSPANIDPKAGELLLSEPMLTDPNFRRSAILILDRDIDGGQLGLIMNHRIEASVANLLDDWPGTENMPLFNGGPVELDRLFMLHRLGDIIDNSLELIPGLWTGGDLDQLREYIADGNPTEGVIRFFFGYSGWCKGQLTSEIMQNSWGVNMHPEVADILTGSGEQYWRREVSRLGDSYRSWLSIPQHPSLN